MPKFYCSNDLYQDYWRDGEFDLVIDYGNGVVKVYEMYNVDEHGHTTDYGTQVDPKDVHWHLLSEFKKDDAKGLIWETTLDLILNNFQK